MADEVTFSEKPGASDLVLLVGWRQWADAGSISSGLPLYLVQQLKAHQIGVIPPDGYYIFQIPGTHDLVRPVVKFDEGHPEYLQSRRNEFFYAPAKNGPGLVIFLGDEPHLDIDRYVDTLLEAAQSLGVRRVISLGGVYGELPYDKERPVAGIYSLSRLKDEMSSYAVDLSDYHGGASIGSYVCKRAGEKGIEFVGFYAFVPTYDFSNIAQAGKAIRVETDYMAWLGVMRRINHMLRLDFDLGDLEEKGRRLVKLIDAKVDEIEQANSQAGVRTYLQHLSDNFEETLYDPLGEVWEDELRRLMDKFDDDSGEG
ncbi:MAG: PAC2 family protein [Anaerolineales bacterium]|jgi:proteasome assembly chaperone (PAC2) family protein